MSLAPTQPSSAQHGEATPGVATAAIPSLPSGPADRIYSLDGQLFVAVPLARYQALMESQHWAHASHFQLPCPDTYAPAPESSAVRTWSAHGSPAPTAAPCANASISATAGPGNMRLDGPCESRTRVPIACVNCHEMRKSCDAARPCQRCIRRGLGASCVDHARAARRSSTRSQSSSGSSSTMLPSIGDSVPSVGHEDQGGSSGQNPPLFPQQYPSFLLEETASAAAASNMDVNALWSSY